MLPQDLRHAVRGLRNAPGFTAIAALTLAVGIGANSAIFSIIDAVLLRPLPFPKSEQLVRLYETESAPGRYPFAGPDYADWKAQNHTFQDMSLFGWPNDMNLSGAGSPDHVRALPTEANFFALLGVKPLLGRTWATGEDQPERNQVAVLSYGFWRSRFAGDPAAVGRSIELNSKKYTIAGVMPPDFQYPGRTQLWIPLDMSPQGLGTRGSHWANAIGRLKPESSVSAARADLKEISARLEKRYPDSNYKVGSMVVPLRDDLVGNNSRRSLWMMLAVVGLVLLIACANVANLLLSKALARQKEMAVRIALGAGRFRLVRQLLTESLLLAAVGGALGLLLAWGLIALFANIRGFAIPRFNPVRVDGSVLAFTFALAVATGVLFGLFPALETSRPNLHDELKGGAGSSNSPSRRRRFASNVLVVCEIALSLVLLVSAGLLLKDFVRMRGLDIGVRTEGVWTAALRLPETRFATPQQRFTFAQSLLEQTRSIPGVQSAALTDHLPLEGGSNYYITERGKPGQRMSGPLVEQHAVSPEYFQAMGIRLVRGRLFTHTDMQDAWAQDERLRQLRADGAKPTPAQTNAIVFPVVINDAMARTFWPDENPLGRMFSPGNSNGPWRQVIGVVNDVRQWGLTVKPVPEAYDVFRQNSRLFLVLHTKMAPSALHASVRHVVEQLDSSMPLFSVRTMDEVVSGQAQGQRFLSSLIGSFAGVAALLAAIGIYGVLSYAVTQRTREIGIRMSLGASRRRVLGETLLAGMRLAIAGFVLGLGGAIAGGRLLASLLNEVKPGDPVVIAATAILMMAVALLACYLPAVRAARLEPMKALRYE